MRNNHAKIDNDEFEVKFDFAQKRLRELLKILDHSDGFEIVALHIDQALNALNDVRERNND